MANKIVSGDYSDKPITLAGGIPTIVMGWNPKNNIVLNTETVEKYEIASEGEKKRGGRAVVGAVLAGPLGLAVGALSAKTKGILIGVEMKDGKKLLIECDKKFHDALVKSCY